MIYNKVIRRIHKDEQFYGWNYLEGILYEKLPRGEQGVDLDCFLDSYVWSRGSAPHDRPWIGIVHALESGHTLTLGRVMSTPNVLKSLPHCVALVTLSRHAKECLEKLVDIPVFNTHHPKRTSAFFDMDAYFSNPTLRHSGFHARNIKAFEEFETSLTKVINTKGHSGTKKEIQYEVGFKGKNEYIKNLCSSVGFCNLNGASANNSVLEHIVSHTPIVVNRLPSVEEYIGPEYPMYYEIIKDKPDEFLLSRSFIEDTYCYLKERSKIKIFSEQNFINFFINFQ
jgi:hypothetical protein